MSIWGEIKGRNSLIVEAGALISKELGRISLILFPFRSASHAGNSEMPKKQA
jgi:hypothetical protein